MIVGLCAVLNSCRGLQKCSFASVTLHKTRANFNTGLGSPISSFTVLLGCLFGFFFSVTIVVSFCCCWFALRLHSFCWAVFKGRGAFPAPKKSRQRKQISYHEAACLWLPCLWRRAQLSWVLAHAVLPYIPHVLPDLFFVFWTIIILL